MEVKKEARYEGDADAPSSSFFVTTVRFGFDDDDDWPTTYYYVSSTKIALFEGSRGCCRW